MEIIPAARIPNGHPLADTRTSGGAVDVRGTAPPPPPLGGPALRGGNAGGQDGPAPGAQVGGTVSVEFARHASGVNEVKFFDKRTGEMISSTPCEKVLDAVTALIDLVRKKA